MLTHDAGGPIAMAVDVGGKEVADRGVGGRIDVGRDAGASLRSAGEVFVTALPLYHVFALTVKTRDVLQIARERPGTGGRACRTTSSGPWAGTP